jgi:hypothetical protein
MRDLSSRAGILRCLGAALALALGAAAPAALARTQALPAAVRACAQERDPGRRLDCYDRAVARYSPPPPGHAPARSTVAPAHRAPAPREAAPDDASPKVTRAPQARPHESMASRLASALDGSGSGPQRLTARIAAIHRGPDALVLRLDNGEVWRQAGRASGVLTLRVGDTVTIRKRLGDYWLSARYVYAMQVRRQSR